MFHIRNETSLFWTLRLEFESLTSFNSPELPGSPRPREESDVALLISDGAGAVGSAPLSRLAGQAETARALTQGPAKARFPHSVIPAASNRTAAHGRAPALPPSRRRRGRPDTCGPVCPPCGRPGQPDIEVSHE